MRNDAGYSLMEVLVMLAITALLSATVLESVRAAASNGLRIERAARQAAQPYVSMAALRLAVEGTRTDYRDSEHAFKGDVRGFSALTASPLVADTSSLEPYRVFTETRPGGGALIYEDRGGQFEVLRWRGGEARFRYFGEIDRSIADVRNTLGQPKPKRWTDSWPQQGVSGGLATHFIASPLAVELIVPDENGEQRIIFQSPADAGPPARIDDVF